MAERGLVDRPPRSCRWPLQGGRGGAAALCPAAGSSKSPSPSRTPVLAVERRAHLGRHLLPRSSRRRPGAGSCRKRGSARTAAATGVPGGRGGPAARHANGHPDAPLISSSPQYGRSSGRNRARRCGHGRCGSSLPRCVRRPSMRISPRARPGCRRARRSSDVRTPPGQRLGDRRRPEPSDLDGAPRGCAGRCISGAWPVSSEAEPSLSRFPVCVALSVPTSPRPGPAPRTPDTSSRGQATSPSCTAREPWATPG